MAIDTRPEIARLRDIKEVVEDSRHTSEHLEADKRSIANAV
jgi:hypothetical protein